MPRSQALFRSRHWAILAAAFLAALVAAGPARQAGGGSAPDFNGIVSAVITCTAAEGCQTGDDGVVNLLLQNTGDALMEGIEAEVTFSAEFDKLAVLQAHPDTVTCDVEGLTVTCTGNLEGGQELTLEVVSEIAVPSDDDEFCGNIISAVGIAEWSAEDKFSSSSAGAQLEPCGTTFTVNNNGDAADLDLEDGLCNAGAGFCTLRAAIEQANATEGKDTIHFAPGLGLIAPQTDLPIVSGPVNIDNDLAGGEVQITSDGGHVLDVRGGNSRVMGLTLYGGNLGGGLMFFENGGNEVIHCWLGTTLHDDPVTGNFYGVILASDGNLAQGNIIAGNRVGLDVQGNGNVIDGNVIRGNDVAMEVSGSENRIGVPGAAPSNHIQGPGGLFGAIYIYSEQATGNVVANNWIGINGPNAARNFGFGVQITGASGNVIGGLDEESRNVITGNSDGGILINTVEGGDPANDNQVLGNYIGVGVDGGAPPPIPGDRGPAPPVHGVSLLAGSSGTVVQGNVISGHTGDGVYVEDSADNTISANRIGTDAAGELAVPNGGRGVALLNSPGNLVGGDTFAQGNVISGNALNGLLVQGTASTDIEVRANHIGSDIDGDVALPNGSTGIEVDDGAAHVTIANNVVAYNLGLGIGYECADDTVVQGNLVLANASGGLYICGNANQIGGPGKGGGNIISSNGGNGIYLSGPVTEGNAIQGNLIGVTPDGISAAPNTGYGIHLKDAAHNTIGGHSPDERNVVSGNALHGIYIEGALSTGNFVGSNLVGTDITGDSPVPNTGVGISIVLGALANQVGAPGSGNVISGNTQGGLGMEEAGGNTVQANRIGLGASPGVLVPNAGNGIDLIPSGGGAIIGGSGEGEGNIISGNAGTGIYVASDNNTIAGNYIGTDETGNAAVPNGGDGVRVLGTLNNIGVPDAGNIISGNAGNGLSLAGGQATLAQANRIGAGAWHGVAVPNGADGVHITDGSGSLLGGAVLPHGNVIGGNLGRGVAMAGVISAPVSLVGNYIGVDSNGDPLANGADGVFVGPPFEAVDGLPFFSIAVNEIAFNAGAGIVVFGDKSVGVPFFNNRIHDNGGLGIDLGSDGVTPNHGQGNTVIGPNHFQNYPVLTSIVLTGPADTTINGTLDTIGDRPYEIEFFANDSCDPSGHGEGQHSITAVTVTTDGNGHAAFSVPVSALDISGKYVTATARNVTPDVFDPYADDTSEFSLCLAGPKGAAIDLFEGWNLVPDWPGDEAGTAAEVIALLDASVDPNTWDSIAHFTGSIWLQTFANAPLPSFNTLTDLEEGEDYWLFVTADTQLFLQ
jgi:parallel beta-helix repeat protein